ncbi:MAG: Do family serine endopeptidase [Spirochaetaceae bacterium]
MSRRSFLASGRFLVINLVLVGVILGFSLSTLVFSRSSRIQPGDAALAQQSTGQPELDLGVLQHSFRNVANQVLPSVVRIDVEEVRTQEVPRGNNLPWFDFFFGEPEDDDRQFRTQGLGSGVIVRRSGNTYYVLTNDHVVGDADKINILLDDSREFDGRLIGKDARKDLAMISFESRDRDIDVARLGDSETLRVGDWVIAIGSPFGFQSTVTAGIISAVGRRGGPQGNISDFIQTDASINQGNSGGALVNLRGQVVGINTWITSQTGGSVGLGFSIPVNNVKSAIDDFIESGSVQYGWLGVSIRDVDTAMAEDLGIRQRDGALVHHVFRGSPADRGGILPGDFILTVNGRRIEDADELILRVGDLPAGEDAVFELVRQSDVRTLRVRISVREDEESIADLNRSLWPGVTAYPLTEEVREEFELPRRVTGIVVSGVENRTPVAVAGIRIGDIITGMNGRNVSSLSDFYRELAVESGETVEFTLLREGEPVTVAVESP